MCRVNKLHLLSAVILYMIFSLSGIKLAFADTAPNLYVIFDASASMKHPQPVIVEILDEINVQLANDSYLTSHIRLLTFREDLEKQSTLSLKRVSQNIAKTILLESEENILPVLESLVETSELNDAIVLIFTDGKNRILADSDTNKLMNNLANRRSQFHVFGLSPTSCKNKKVYAIDAKERVLSPDGKMIDCGKNPFIHRNRNWLKAIEVETDKLTELAFSTGGLVWPIYHFHRAGLDLQNARADLVEVAATKLTKIIKSKGNIPLSATVNYPNQVYIGDTVYFEVSKSVSSPGVGEIIDWQWDFDGDGQLDDIGTFVSKVFHQSGDFTVTLELSNGDNPKITRTLQLPITVIE